jgi:hypothetical protein
VARATTKVLEKLQAYARSLPEVTERLSHGAPTFFVRDKKSFLMTFPDGHHDAHFPQAWCACEPILREHLMKDQPTVFFVPPYVGDRGWVGIRLDVASSYDELTDVLDNAYRLIAPSSLVAKMSTS